MSGPESINSANSRPISKRPRLLDLERENASGKDAAPSMLASLERDGRLIGSVAPASHGRPMQFVARGIAVLCLMGGGALFAQRWLSDPATPVASAVLFKPASSARPAAAPSSVAVDRQAGSAAVGSAASAPARIEHDEVAEKFRASVMASSNSAAASGASASRNPLDRLALVTSDTAPAAHGKKRAAKDTADPSSAHVGASAKSLTRKPGGSVQTVGKVRKDEVDADTELVAAMIARLDRRGSEPGTRTPDRRFSDAPGGLARKVRECEATMDLLESRRCRNRVCDAHWGKADACPASRAPKL